MIVLCFPVVQGKTGDRSFLMTEEGVIYERRGSFFFDASQGRVLGGSAPSAPTQSPRYATDPHGNPI